MFQFAVCLRGRELEDRDGVLNGGAMIYGLSQRKGPFEVADEKGLATDWVKAPQGFEGLEGVDRVY